MKSKKELEEDYHWWITCIPDSIDLLKEILPIQLYNQLDYSVTSLSILGKYLLDKYTVESLMSAVQEWEAFASYTGVVYEKNVPTAKWRVELEDDKNAYYGVPALRTRANTNFYPMYEITTMLGRKSPELLELMIKKHIELQTSPWLGD